MIWGYHHFRKHPYIYIYIHIYIYIYIQNLYKSDGTYAFVYFYLLDSLVGKEVSQTSSPGEEDSMVELSKTSKFLTKKKATKIVKTSNLFSSLSLTNISQEDVRIKKVIHVISSHPQIHRQKFPKMMPGQIPIQQNSKTSMILWPLFFVEAPKNSQKIIHRLPAPRWPHDFGVFFAVEKTRHQ